MSTSKELGPVMRQWLSLPQQQHGAQQVVFTMPTCNTLELLKKRQKLALRKAKTRFF